MRKEIMTNNNPEGRGQGAQSPKEFEAEQIGGENKKDIVYTQAEEEGPQPGLESAATDFTFSFLSKN